MGCNYWTRDDTNSLDELHNPLVKLAVAANSQDVWFRIDINLAVINLTCNSISTNVRIGKQCHHLLTYLLLSNVSVR